MSGRFFRSGHRLVQNLLHQTRRAHQHTNQHVHVAQPFAISFTAPQAMMAAAGSSQPLIGNSSSALGSVAATGIRSASTQAGSKGCGSPSCCQGMTAISSGEDGEEPFIGAPSLSSPNQSFTRGVSASSNDNKQFSCNNSNNNTNNNNNCSTASANSTISSSTSSPAPPPRVKCDPYEQGGHPLTTDVVQQHMAVTLDPSWQYDEAKKLLVRSFEFGRTFPRGEDVAKLFSFVADLGKIQTYGAHPLYNLNLNLRANSLQVMLRTVPLRGISFQDLMLGTKIDGMWFRLMQAKEAEERRQAQIEARERAQQQQTQQMQAKATGGIYEASASNAQSSASAA